MALNTPSGLILPRDRWPENIFDTRHPSARRAGRAPTAAPSERDAGNWRSGDNGTDRRSPAAFQPVPFHAALADNKIFAELARKAGRPRRLMIDATHLKGQPPVSTAAWLLWWRVATE